MRMLITIGILILFILPISGQIVKTGGYKFTTTVQANDSNLGITATKFPQEISAGHKISVIDQTDSLVYFKYWIFTNESLRPIYNTQIFSMPIEEFERLTTPIYPIFKGAKVGTYSIPIRLRGIGKDNFDFESSLSLQTNLVFGFGKKDKPNSFIDLSIGLGLTGVQLNADNSDIMENRSGTAFTLSCGVLIKPHPLANIGLFWGVDWLSQSDSETNWVYQGKPWLGLGINISFTEAKSDIPIQNQGTN
ncbi:MAG: hypothetical protein KDC34_06860 [Saprospiraceae bacterium]|nr:hypothetical protein [Saprospiraceae bacterium]